MHHPVYTELFRRYEYLFYASYIPSINIYIRAVITKLKFFSYSTD